MGNWKKGNDKKWTAAAIKYLRENEATWTAWVPEYVAEKVRASLR